MRKTVRNILIGLGCIMALPVLLLVVAMVLLNSDTMQNRLLAYATELLSEKLNTEVRIGNADIDLFQQKVRLDDVDVKDLQQREMLQIESMGVAVNLRSLLHDELKITEANISGINAQLFKEHPDSASNFQFVIDAFKNDKKKKHGKKLAFELDKLTAERINLAYNGQHLALQRIDFREKGKNDLIGIDSLRLHIDNHKPLKRLGKPHRGYFDTGHMDIVANARIEINIQGKDSVSGKMVSCDAKDHVSGLYIPRLQFDFVGNKEKMQLNDVHINLKNTKLTFDHAHVKLPNKKTGKKLSYYTSTIKGKVILTDIAHPFAPILKDFKMPLSLHTKMSGDDNSIHFRNIHVATYDKKLRIEAKGNLHHLKGKHKLHIHFDVKKMTTTGTKVRQILKQLPTKKFMMKQLEALGNISYHGSFDILWRKEMFRGKIHTVAGPMDFNFSLDGNSKYATGMVNTDSFRLGNVIGMKDIKKVVCMADFKFDFSKQRTALVRKMRGGKLPIGEVNATIKETDYKFLKLKNIVTSIKSDGAVAQGSVSNKGKLIDLLCDFSFTNTDSLHKMKIKPHIKLHNIFSKKDKVRMTKEEKEQLKEEKKQQKEEKKQLKEEKKLLKKQQKEARKKGKEAARQT